MFLPLKLVFPDKNKGIFNICEENRNMLTLCFSASLLSHSNCVMMVVKRNHTPSAEFVLSGFSEQGGGQAVLFMVFLVIYVITLLRNLGMLVLIRLSAQLHTPMTSS